MSERRRRRRFFDLSGFDEEDFLFGREPAEGGSGYSISVTYDEKGKPVVQVKTYGDVDMAELRRDIEQRYPGAKIEGLEKKPLIRIVDEEEKEKAKDDEEASMGS
ncbi:MAG: hypothetical protein AOA66_0416 [Candidatus Bathyarchaeota archaeon BA2]|nr:MAG: hypothetical protein AOA66_0416 [Candidatus Bathyarchaeota archaeon BA2]